MPAKTSNSNKYIHQQTRFTAQSTQGQIKDCWGRRLHTYLQGRISSGIQVDAPVGGLGDEVVPQKLKPFCQLIHKFGCSRDQIHKKLILDEGQIFLRASKA